MKRTFLTQVCSSAQLIASLMSQAMLLKPVRLLELQAGRVEEDRDISVKRRKYHHVEGKKKHIQNEA